MAKGEDRVEAAEGEGVGEGDLLFGLTGSMEDYVEVEGEVYFGYSGVSGELLLVEGNDGGQGFDGSGGSDRVAMEGFCGTDRDL